MDLPDWIEIEENFRRSLGNPSRYRLTPHDDVSVNADYWHNWDYQLKPGAYELVFLGSSADWWNYFVVGPVPFANQPQPVKPQQRFGAIVNKGRPQWRNPVRFQAERGTVVRVEAWVCVPDRQNPAPLPSGFDHWPLPIPFFGNGWFNAPSFANHFQAVSRRVFADRRLEFGMEDSGDGDFNDLIVALQRVGD